jgi:hypothetical protein
MKIIVLILVAIFLIAIAVGLYRTYKTQHSSNAKLFLAGSLPNPAPDGFYKGNVRGYSGAWQGKKFDASSLTGVNIYLKPDQITEEHYPFSTYTGEGLRDKSIQVLKIDYAKANNPFWVKMILDEVVETEPGHYLGKIHLRLLPGISFAIGYFTLEK